MKQKNLDILKKKGSGFKVPEGYFDTVEDTVLSELISKKFPKKHGFSVPKGYFDVVEDAVNSKLAAELLPDKEGFTIPEGYFDSVEEAVFAKLGKETQKSTTSYVPEGYFDTLEDRVFARLKEKESVEEPKVISLGSRIRKVWAPVAIAASLALLVVFQNKSGGDQLEVTAAEIDKLIEEDLINLDSYEIAEVFNDVDLTSNDMTGEDDELLDYLKGTDVESMLLEN